MDRPYGNTFATPRQACPVDIAPNTIDLDVGLVDEPPVAGRVPGEAGGIREQGREPLHPPVDGDVIDLDTSLGKQLLDIMTHDETAPSR